jgi:hypothetical protein
VRGEVLALIVSEGGVQMWMLDDEEKQRFRGGKNEDRSFWVVTP